MDNASGGSPHPPAQDDPTPPTQIVTPYLAPSVPVQPQVEIQQSFSGPLPLPSILRAYDDIEPGTAQRFFDDYFAQRQHDRELERAEQESQRLAIEGNLQLARRGQNISVPVIVFLGALTLILALTGHDGVAAVLGGTALVGVIVPILTGRMRPREGRTPDDTSQSDGR